MRIEDFNSGDKVLIQTKEKEFEGILLESYESEVILLKLKNGYNVGIRQRDILEAKLIEKSAKKENNKLSFEKNKSLPNIALIITGGTISSRLDSKTGGVISTDAEEILNISPEIHTICNIKKIEKPFMKFSEDMGSKDWKKLAEKTAELLNEEDIKGVVITHGTDTLHYTSSALSFFLKDLNKPVAITYSQRSIDRGSTDASLNLFCAVKYAISDIAEVSIVGHATENDDFCFAIRGNRTRKMHTSKRNTFKAINSTAIAKIGREEFDILQSFNARDDKKKVKLDNKFSDKVAIIKVFPDSSPEILEFYEKLGYQGIILEVTGLGQVPGRESEKNWISKIKKSVESGMIICATAQTIYGTLNPNVYSSGRDLQKTGIIFLRDMLSETAFVKLGWILGHSSWAKDKEKIEKLMLENISGEITLDEGR